MHIALIHNSLIPPVNYGGIPRVIYNLAVGLIEKGHKVSLLALPGSRIKNCNFIDISGADINSPSIQQKIPENTDLVHFHYNPPFTPDLPYLVTIHGNSFNPDERFLPYTNFLSKNHAQNHGGKRFVYNGIDVTDTRFTPKQNYFVFLAKASWSVKNVRTAIQLCKENKYPLKICGGKGFSFSPYIRYMGMVNDREKREILPPAKALLFPVNWYEPFGIAVLEAMVYGTPVIASPNGAMPELIKNGISGYICSSYEEFPEAMNKVSRIKAEDTRQWVKNNFTLEKMTEGYIKLYKEILAGKDWGGTAHSIKENRVKKIYKRTLSNYIYYNILH